MSLGLPLSRSHTRKTAHKAHAIIECLDLLQDQRWKNRGGTAANILHQVSGQPTRRNRSVVPVWVTFGKLSLIGMSRP